MRHVSEGADGVSYRCGSHGRPTPSEGPRRHSSVDPGRPRTPSVAGAEGRHAEDALNQERTGSKTSEDPMTVAIYARVSTHDQTAENQLLEMRRYVEARGWSSVEYVDQGVSGAKDRRPALDQLVADVRRHRVQAVVCWRLDRLGRNLRHLVLLLDEWSRAGSPSSRSARGSTRARRRGVSSPASLPRSRSSSARAFRSASTRVWRGPGRTANGSDGHEIPRCRRTCLRGSQCVQQRLRGAYRNLRPRVGCEKALRRIRSQFDPAGDPACEIV